MTWMSVEWARREILSDAKVPASNLSPGLRVASVILRALFLACLLVVTLRVSMPQSETIWTAYETPGDLIRMGLGLAVCVGILIQLFAAPKDPQRHRTWLYLGLAAVPFALICVVAVW
jgi:archaellum biogenesis protein FlaJ (TadC family)